jgi:hypothetical protein
VFSSLRPEASLTVVSYLSCFDGHANPSSCNRSVLILMQNTRGGIASSFSLFCPLLPASQNNSISFQCFTHSLSKHPGYTYIDSSPCKLSSPPRTNPQRPLHTASHGGTIFFAGNLPLFPVSNISERTTGSPARVIQQSARNRRPGPLAIRSRYPAIVHRPGKASSVRLGQRSIVGP